MASKSGSGSGGGEGTSGSSPNYPELKTDLEEFAQAWKDLRVAEDVMDEVGDYLGDLYEYEYESDEYDFEASGWRETVEEYVYETLGLPEYNDMRQKVREIANKIADRTGMEELRDDDDDYWGPLTDFAEENNIEINRPPTPITKHDLNRHRWY